MPWIRTLRGVRVWVGEDSIDDSHAQAIKERKKRRKEPVTSFRYPEEALEAALYLRLSLMASAPSEVQIDDEAGRQAEERPGTVGVRQIRRSKLPRPNAVDQKIRGSKLTGAQVIEIRNAYAQGASYAHLASKYKMHITNIGCIVMRKSWKHIPYTEIEIEAGIPEHNERHKYFTDDEVRTIRRFAELTQVNYTQLAKLYDSQAATIRSIVLGLSYKNVLPKVD